MFPCLDQDYGVQTATMLSRGVALGRHEGTHGQICTSYFQAKDDNEQTLSKTMQAIY